MIKNETGINYNYFGKQLNILLVYPDTYNIGMSSLSFLNGYRILNENEWTSCDRFFIDSKSNFGLETGKIISDFEIIAFTISYENLFKNIINFFRRFNFSLQKNNRVNKKIPLFIIGGEIIKIYPEIFIDIFDIVVQCDFEIFIEEVNKYFLEKKNYDKQEFKNYLESQNIVYNGKSDFINAKKIFAYSSIASTATVFKNTFLIELTRGCPNSCNFCVSGKNHNYFSEIEYESLINIFEKLKQYLKKFGIIGLSVLKYKWFSELCNYAIENQIELNFSSLEIMELSEEKIELLKKVNQLTFTIAPETFSLKIQNIINKKIEINILKEKLLLLNKYHIKNLKLYMLYGIDEEEESDLIINCEAIKLLSEIFNGIIKVRFNPLIPKPVTPFANRKIQDKKLLKKKMKFFKQNLSGIKNVRLDFLDIKEAQHQNLKLKNLIE